MAIFDEPSREPLPQPTFEDVTHATRKGLVSIIPFVGGAGSELLGLLSSPVAQRRDDWFADLERRLRDLEKEVNGFRFDDLGQNEQFVSATLQATQAALRTHQKEKLEALRNAVLNIAIGHAPAEDEQAMFLSYIDELSTWHIRLLIFLNNPLDLVHQRKARTDYFIGGSISQLLEDVYPELRGKREFYDQIMRDLRSRGFINSAEDVLHVMMTASTSGMFAKRTTEMADRFLKFITSPT